MATPKQQLESRIVDLVVHNLKDPYFNKDLLISELQTISRRIAKLSSHQDYRHVYKLSYDVNGEEKVMFFDQERHALRTSDKIHQLTGYKPKIDLINVSYKPAKAEHLYSIQVLIYQNRLPTRIDMQAQMIMLTPEETKQFSNCKISPIARKSDLIGYKIEGIHHSKVLRTAELQYATYVKKQDVPCNRVREYFGYKPKEKEEEILDLPTYYDDTAEEEHDELLDYAPYPEQDF